MSKYEYYIICADVRKGNDIVSNTSSSFFLCLLQTLVFCSGQIYYELLAERENRGRTDVAIVRLEQIAPFAFERIAKNAARYKDAEVVWAQQEPKYVTPFVDSRKPGLVLYSFFYLSFFSHELYPFFRH